MTKLLEASGDDVIYFGDHLPADVVECREQSLWRTCLIVPELSSMDDDASEDEPKTGDDIDALKIKLSRAVSKTCYRERSIFRYLALLMNTILIKSVQMWVRSNRVWQFHDEVFRYLHGISL